MRNFYFLLLVSFSLISCTSDDAAKHSKNNSLSKDENLAIGGPEIDKNSLLTKNLSAKIHTVHGNIVIKFYPTKAPNTVRRIKELIESGFYDGIIFHRVVPNFVIQAGDPTGTGRGGSGNKLKAEFNDLKHEKGIVAMARTNDPDSADSQFYIALGNLPHLDGKYTIFGKVTEGIDILDKVSKGDKILTLSIQK